MDHIQAYSVTIVIPVFNRETILETTLQSVLKQSYGNYHCIIVDDGSTDSTISVARKFQNADERISVVENPQNSGACYCRNLGLTMARTEYIVFLDSDDIWLPHFLETMLVSLNESSGFDAAACQALVFEKETGDMEGIRFSGVSSPINMERYLLQEVAWITSCMLWKTKAIRAVGGFAEHLKMWQDWDLNVRFLGAGGKVLPVPKNLLYSKVGGHAQITNQIQGRQRLMHQFLSRENSWKSNKFHRLSQCSLNCFVNDFTMLAAVFLAFRDFLLSIKALRYAFSVRPYPSTFFKFLNEYLTRTRFNIILKRLQSKLN
jgi:glycosyltransferase involved in cell wall biosynthesis